MFFAVVYVVVVVFYAVKKVSSKHHYALALGAAITSHCLYINVTAIMMKQKKLQDNIA